VQPVASPDWADAIAATGFPCVIKAVGLSGSRGVIRADGPRELASAIERIRRLLARPEIRSTRAGLEDEVLIESYIDGAEFAIEGVMTDGRFERFAIFDKPDPLVGPFFEETIYVTPSRLDAVRQARISSAIEHAAAALGLGHGPIHGECRVAGDAVYVLEVAARPIGGLCSRVLEFERDGQGATGEERASLERVLLEHAIGRPIDRWTRERAAAAVMMIPIPKRGLLKRVTGDDAARRVRGVTEVIVTAKTDQLLEPLPEAGSYLGFVFARADTPGAAERAVREAHAALAFEIEPPIAVRSVSADAADA
jgi:formate-dependent phosphoribosylglycinamide formyltransferase (GAR transformylase)